MPKKTIIFISVSLLFLLGFFLRVLPFNYGSFIAFNDTGLFRSALNLGKALAEHNFSQLKVYVVYPYLFSYVFLFFFGIFYLIGTIGGMFSSLGDFLKYAVLDMDKLFELSRIIIAVSGALLIPLVYLITKQITSARAKSKENKWILTASLLATMLMTFSLLHIHIAKLVRPHVPVALFIVLAFCAYLNLLRKKNSLSYVLMGAASGLAAGTLQPGFLSILFLALGNFFLTKERSEKDRFFNKLKKFFSRQFILSLIIFALVIAVCYPYAFSNPVEALNLKEGKFNLTLSGGRLTDYGDNPTNFTGGGFATELKALIFYEPGLIIALLFLLIVFVATRKKKINDENIVEKSSYYNSAIIGIICFWVCYLVLFGIYNKTGYRMLCSLIPFLCILTGIIFFAVLNKLSDKKHKYWIICFLVLMLAFSIFQSLKFINLVTKDSTQDLAGKWIRNNINPNKMIAIESHSHLKLTPSKESLQKRADLLGIDSLGQKEMFLLSLNEKDYPKDAMNIFPLFYSEENYNQLNEFLKTGADYLILGYYTQNPEINALQQPNSQIITFLNKQLILIKKFSPFKDGSERFSLFPQDMVNPILDLWAYQRMGPIIEIYQINR